MLLRPSTALKIRISASTTLPVGNVSVSTELKASKGSLVNLGVPLHENTVPASYRSRPQPPPIDLFAGPTATVYADSLTNRSEDVVEASQPSPRLFDRQYYSAHASTAVPSPKTNIMWPSEDHCSSGVRTPESTSDVDEIDSNSNIKRFVSKADTLPTTTTPTIDDIIRRHHRDSMYASGRASAPPVPTVPSQWKQAKEDILSIDEIIQRNSTNVIGVRASSMPPPKTSASVRTASNDSDGSQVRSSIDSVVQEALQTTKPQDSPASSTAQQPFDRKLHARTASAAPSDSAAQSISGPASDVQAMDLRGTKAEVVQYLRSPRLTRILTLRKEPNKYLRVSYADVGDQNGKVVVVFLGLGSVRYLVGLYDEVATSMGLRLICIDRWGLGKTSDIPDSRRGFLEWATVVDEVMEQLHITHFSILAHSAGAPYAIATSIRSTQVVGSLHLLAPWVGFSTNNPSGAYKWLKYVPSSIIRSAQTAEWKVQSWKLGKPPSLQVHGVGHNPKAPISSESAASSPVLSSSFLLPAEASDSGRDPTEPIVFSSSGGLRPSASAPAIPSRTRRISQALKFGMLRSPRSQSTHWLNQTESRGGVLPNTYSATHESSISVATSHKGDHESMSSSSSRLDLGACLLRASHAESLKGGTSDLLAILERTSKPTNFSYAEVQHGVRVWHGSNDDKISLQSVMSLQGIIRNCQIRIVQGADHSLMTNVPVVVEALRSIADERSA
ncbi:hypothetical protein EMMF5_001960 [Cystobasidiomycetes sp. EMM_F5]